MELSKNGAGKVDKLCKDYCNFDVNLLLLLVCQMEEK